MTTAQLINQTSGDVEYFTPLPIIEAARWALDGNIELDPFSSAVANERVGADRYYTAEDDAFTQSWQCSTLWMNHPFGRAYNKRAIERLVAEFRDGEIRVGACCITFACTSEAWFRPLLRYPQCYLHPRTNYHRPDGTLKRGVTRGSVVTLLGADWGRFYNAFKDLGTIKT